jgi:hypothetical protein
MRSREPIPQAIEGAFGPIIRTVSSIDGSNIVYRTYPTIYTRLTKASGYKYNKSKYYWYLNGYLYLPNVEWEAISVTALFEDDITPYTSESADDCTIAQDRQMPIPEFLFAEIEQFALKELMTLGSVPVDAADDKQNALR